MSTTVEAIYENGKLTLAMPLPLPEKTHVRVTIMAPDADASDMEREAWLGASEQSLLKVWDNTDDDAFNELLQK